MYYSFNTKKNTDQLASADFNCRVVSLREFDKIGLKNHNYALITIK